MLSVVVPVHGVEDHLVECLESILGHPENDLEVIAVDDASPDGCPAILDNYAARDERVRVVHLPNNVGLGYARNAGLTHAGGDYVWFVDGDDRLPSSHAIADVLTGLDRTMPDVMLIGHAVLHPYGECEQSGHNQILAGLAGPVTLRQRPELLRVRQAAWNRIVRRDWMRQVGLRFRAGWYEDVGFSHLALLRADRIAALGRACYLYRRRPVGTITSTVSQRHFEVFDQYENLFTELARLSISDGLRGELFTRMIEHYLVIIGTDGRVPPELRGAFFARMVRHYRTYLPADGYRVPRGANGVKHRFVRWDTYGMYAIARRLYRARLGAHWARTGSRPGSGANTTAVRAGQSGFTSPTSDV